MKHLNAFLFLILLSSNASATSVQTVNLVEMVESAARIFHGRCLSVQEVVPSEEEISYYVYEFEVLDGIQGVQTGETLRFRQVMGLRGRHFPIRGLPTFQPGQQLVLFLHGDGETGLTSPVGLHQGVFERREDSLGGVGWLNGTNNTNLAADLTADKAKRLGLDPARLEEFNLGRALSLESLKSSVRSIQRVLSERESKIR